MKTRFTLFFLFFALTCSAQELQIVKPDGKIFNTLRPNDYTVVRTLRLGTVSGRLIQISADSLTVVDPDGVYLLELGEIIAMKKTTRSGAWMRRSRGNSGLAAVLILPGPDFNSERSFGDRMLNRAAIMIPTTMAIFMIASGRPLKKVEKGYSFVVKE